MKITEAVALENWFPQTSYVEIRGGRSSHATGMTDNGKTLMVYNGLTGTNKMFCTTASGTYDVSSSGAVGASVLARTNGKHQWTMFGNGSANYLIGVNGVDKPAYFDGTSWVAVDSGTSPALSNLTTTRIVGVNVFKGRLFYIEIDSLSFWYLPAGDAGGSLVEFDLSGEAKRGGYLMAMGSWTRDAGDGADDVAVFVTSEGEAIIYQGNNPSSSNTWAKIGTFYIGKPIGRRCLQKLGGDLIIITENGAFPISAAAQSASIDYKLALSFKIEPAFTTAARNYGSNFGWSATVYPAHSALIVNIPISEDGEHEQYVMNTITKAWCKFKEWDAEDFTIYNGELYYAAGTAVYKAWNGKSDAGSDIVIYGKQAFSDFGTGEQKKFRMFRPVLMVDGGITFLTDIDVDFQDGDITGLSTYSVVSGAVWDETNWDEGLWAASLETVKQWTSPAEWPGRYAAGKLKINTNSLTVQWVASDMLYETGGGI